MLVELTYDTSKSYIFIVKAVVSANPIVAALYQAGLSPSTSSLINENRSSSHSKTRQSGIRKDSKIWNEHKS